MARGIGRKKGTVGDGDGNGDLRSVGVRNAGPERGPGGQLGADPDAGRGTHTQQAQQDEGEAGPVTLGDLHGALAGVESEIRVLEGRRAALVGDIRRLEDGAASRERSRRQAARALWPAGKRIPSFVVKARQANVPCPKCRRVLREEGGVAAVRTSSGADVVTFRCRCCGHRWKLGVKVVG